jgi:AraC-like DNA-binding protein
MGAIWTLTPEVTPRADRRGPVAGEGGDLEAVTLTVSTARLGVPVTVPRKAFLAAVYVGAGEPLRVKTSTLGEADREMTQRPGEICILGPHSTVIFPAIVRGQMIQYRIPATAVRSLARHWNLGRMDALTSPVVSFDPVLHHLARVSSHLLERSSTSRSRIAEPFARTFYSHLLQRYGVQTARLAAFSGGLSPRHKRIVDEAFAAPFGREISLQQLAGLCGLSAGHFARVFRESFGRPFHQHVMKARLQHSRDLLERTDLPLSEIARRVGYADQASFTESFTRAMRTSPGRFRRRHVTAKREGPAPSTGL